MITKLMDKMKREEEIQNSTYENLYTSLLKKNEIDKIHQIINTFILKWFP
jgi:ribosomal protein L19E